MNALSKILLTGVVVALDALGNLMFEKLAFADGERDMLVLHHEFRAEYPDGRRERFLLGGRIGHRAGVGQANSEIERQRCRT